MRLERFGDAPRERKPVDRQGAAGGNCGLVRRRHHQRAKPSHLLLEEAYCVADALRAQRVAADEFRELRRAVGGGEARGLHFEQGDAEPALRRLPRRLAPGEARPHHDEFLCAVHERASIAKEAWAQASRLTSPARAKTRGGAPRHAWRASDYWVTGLRKRSPRSSSVTERMTSATALVGFAATTSSSATWSSAV